jgi:hypothetical protein
VFLDDNDKKMVLVRATMRVVELDQCGIPATKLFAVYDQVMMMMLLLLLLMMMMMVIMIGSW